MIGRIRIMPHEAVQCEPPAGQRKLSLTFAV